MKILILILSCNESPYFDCGNELKKSYEKLIKHYNLNDNIFVYDYIGNSKTTYCQDRTIYCNSKDDKFSTFSKTIECFTYIENNFEYDYIIRTNTSQFVNIYLLYNLLLKIKDNSQYDNAIFGSIFFCYLFGNDISLDFRNLFMEGSFWIFSKNKIKELLNLNKLYNPQNIDDVDDRQVTNIISNKLNKQYKKLNINNITSEFRSFGCGYYKRVNKNDYNELCKKTDKIPSLWRQYCKDYTDLSVAKFEIYKNFISIKTKSYCNDYYSNVTEGIYTITNEFLLNDYQTNELNDIINNLLNYSNNPDIRVSYINKEFDTEFYIKLSDFLTLTIGNIQHKLTPRKYVTSKKIKRMI